jgi:thiamine-monophosphate kinase
VSEGGNGEFAAIERIRRLLPPAPEGETWIGDDAAVVGGTAGERMLLATDAVVEGVHFDLDLVDAADVGWKALAVNVSDVAAMGGRPLHALVSVVGAGADMLDRLMRGLADASTAYRCDVVGGDLSSGPCLVVAVAVTGTTDGRRAVLRSKALAGDVLYVTGPLGRSAAGLRVLRARAGALADQAGPPWERGSTGDSQFAELAAAYRRPVARVAEGLAASAGGATAMIDVSDGLGIDLDHLATASGVGVVLDTVPIADGASREEALAGGEDYELVFAAGDPDAVARAFAEASLRPPIRIGRCVPERTLRLLGADPLPATGWEHRLKPA